MDLMKVCLFGIVHFILEVYWYQIFLFSDIRYSLFEKWPISIADPIYITSCFSYAGIAHYDITKLIVNHSQQQQNSNKTCKMVINTVKNGDN